MIRSVAQVALALALGSAVWGQDLFANAGPVGLPPDEDDFRQAAAIERGAVFLERSTIAWGSPVGDGVRESLLFEAELGAHLYLFDNLPRAAERGDRWARAGVFSFLPHLRMFNDDSSPVKMPSWRPRVALQWFRLADPGNDDRHWLANATVAVGHYSNGQLGCTYADGLDDGTDACKETNRRVRQGATDLSPLLNRRSGDFSTNYVSLLLGYQRMGLDGNAEPRRTLRLAGRLWMNHGKGPGGISGRDLHLYGRWRFLLAVEYERTDLFDSRSCLTGRSRVRLVGEHGPHDHPAVPETYGQIEVSHTLNKAGGLGGFVRLHAGQDTYNAFFVDDLRQLLIGLMWEPARLFPFKKTGGTP